MVHAVRWQRVEGLLVLAAGLVLFLYSDAGLVWWAAVLVFFMPDLSFVFYLAGPRVGAFAYNAVHIYGLGAVLMAVGLVAAQPLVVGMGALCLAHSGFDRMFGYGLKSPEGFTVTHLGPIGRGRPRR